jgi:hypothetical protein
MSEDEIPQKQRLLSSVYYEVARKWVDLDAAARALEDTKSSLLSQRKINLGNIPKTHAEDIAKADPEWIALLYKIVDARTAANLEKIKLETIRMRHAEQQSKEATARHEARLER